jgi:putative membrane protein
MTDFKLSTADHARISSAVAQVEAKSDAEVVTVIAGRSDSYHDVGLHYAILAMLLFLTALAAFPEWFITITNQFLGGWAHSLTLQQYLGLLLIKLIGIFLIVRFALSYMPLRMLLTPKATKARRVRRAAITLFRAAVDNRTRASTGILIYLSLAEHRAEIVADAAISKVVAPECWGDAMATLIHHVRAGAAGDGMVAAIEEIGVILANHVPKSRDDTDELPNCLIEI